jgi:predicted DNA-binding protein (MmcQ/YjbR family)
VGRYKWAMLESLEVLPDSEIDRCIRKSYAMVAAKSKPSRSRIKKTKRPREPQN